LPRGILGVFNTISKSSNIFETIMHQSFSRAINFTRLQHIVNKTQKNTPFFFLELEERKLDLEGEVFDMLFTLTDFLAFKEMFVDYKITRQSPSSELQGILSVTSL
jgi:ADP-ribosylation factor 2-binding protein